MLINILFIIALTFPVAIASTAFGVGRIGVNNLVTTKEWGRNIIYALIIALGQGVMYVFGSMLGGTFMHMLGKLSHWIVLALCLSVSFRMLTDTLKIKNGENLYYIQNTKHLLLLSIALGVNTFIAGLMAEFYKPFQNITPYLLIGAAFVWSIISIMIPFSKMKLTFYSLLNLIFAGIIFSRGLLFLI